MPAAKSVDQYIREAPVESRAALEKVRRAIREAAPGAEETVSYGMPFYGYPGEVGIEGRLCYFGLKRSTLGLFLRPKDLDPHAEQIAPYRSAKSALHFPLDRPIPISLLQRLVRDADRRHRAGKSHSPRKGPPRRRPSGGPRPPYFAEARTGGFPGTGTNRPLRSEGSIESERPRDRATGRMAISQPQTLNRCGIPTHRWPRRS